MCNPGPSRPRLPEQTSSDVLGRGPAAQQRAAAFISSTEPSLRESSEGLIHLREGKGKPRKLLQEYQQSRGGGVSGDLIRDRRITVGEMRGRDRRKKAVDQKEGGSRRHILIHNYISHFVSSPTVFFTAHISVGQTENGCISVSFSFQPSCFFVFVL